MTETVKQITWEVEAIVNCSCGREEHVKFNDYNVDIYCVCGNRYKITVVSLVLGGQIIASLNGISNNSRLTENGED